MNSKPPFIRQERQLDRIDPFDLIRRQRYPIVFLYRRLMNGVGAGHAVIPVRLTRNYVIFLDPLRGERRVRWQADKASRRYDWRPWPACDKMHQVAGADTHAEESMPRKRQGTARKRRTREHIIATLSQE